MSAVTMVLFAIRRSIMRRPDEGEMALMNDDMEEGNELYVIYCFSAEVY